MIQSVDNCVYIENRFPIFSQDVKANISFQVYIWMVDLRVWHDKLNYEFWTDKENENMSQARLNT